MVKFQSTDTVDIRNTANRMNLRQAISATIWRFLRKQHPNAKLLLGVRRTELFEDSLSATKIADEISNDVKSKTFDGIFIHFEGFHLDDLSSVAFLQYISISKELFVALRLTESRVFEHGKNSMRVKTAENLQMINSMSMVNNIYLDMKHLPLNEEPSRTIQGTETIKRTETIQGTVEELWKQGITPSKNVIGLKAGGWKYEIKDCANLPMMAAMEKKNELDSRTQIRWTRNYPCSFG